MSKQRTNPPQIVPCFEFFVWQGLVNATVYLAYSNAEADVIEHYNKLIVDFEEKYGHLFFKD